MELLQSVLEQKEYGEAVRCYLAALPSLLRYSHVPSVASIADESKQLMADVEKQVRGLLLIKDVFISAHELLNCRFWIVLLESMYFFLFYSHYYKVCFECDELKEQNVSPIFYLHTNGIVEQLRHCDSLKLILVDLSLSSLSYLFLMLEGFSLYFFNIYWDLLQFRFFRDSN